MRKVRMLLITGVWVAILPYLGFPQFYKNLLFSLTGFVVMYFSYVWYRENKKEDKNFDTFSENNFVGEEMVNN
ncbi:hypothetical protein HZA26_03890 [Candidatus Nomurabacteria bacterium]|nr:hypothetical protein [Candidatus Nomurabacteria bacterium]